MQQVRQQIQSLDGDAFRQLIAAATHCLERNADSINALNVFPVPDGDTGVNMFLTMRSLAEQAETLPLGTSLSEVVHVMARGALLGARGNSGVILSQFFKGLAKGLEECPECSSKDLARALQQAADAAYKAVGKPVEGTMLTVMHAMAKAAMESGDDRSELQIVWTATRDAAVAALARTPEQLPVLREAGVVDAGGQGMVALLEGGLAYLQGEEVQELTVTAPVDGLEARFRQVSLDYLATTEEELYGYCTSFVVSGEKLDVDAIRDSMTSMAGSTVVVGDVSLLKVHVHVFDPGPIISYAVSLGSLSQVQIDNIDEQHQEFMAAHRQPKNIPVAVVAVAAGDGLENVFRNLGAAVMVRGGQTMNPSAQELLEAVQRVAADEVVLLPNNVNIVLTARQAAQLSERRVHVVPTHNIPQGIAALMVFNPEQDAQANVVVMTGVLGDVHYGEVTTAIRTTSVDGRQIHQGQTIGFLDGALVGVADTQFEVLQQVLQHAGSSAGALVTLYWGEGLDRCQAEDIAQRLRYHLPSVEVELVEGGQPYYHFILSIE